MGVCGRFWAGWALLAAGRALGAVAGWRSALTGSAPALAQDYPTKTVTLVVPYPPGGGVDVLARVVAEQALRRRSASR